MWQCDDRPDCYRSGWTSEISGTGDGFEVVTREQAADHARKTGHEVEFVKGTIERMIPLRTGDQS
jgi:hypothetical protein